MPRATIPSGVARGASACVRDTARNLPVFEVCLAPTAAAAPIRNPLTFVASNAAPLTSSTAAYIKTSTAIVFPPSPPASPQSSLLEGTPLSIRDLALGGATKPPFTPRRSTDSLASLSSSVSSLASSAASVASSASSFLADVFPTDATMVAPAVVDDDVVDWPLALVDRTRGAEGTRTLYARLSARANDAPADLRDNVVAVLDRADELDCDAVVVCLDKHDAELAQTIHSLMYVGGSVINPALSAHDASAFVLVGLDV